MAKFRLTAPHFIEPDFFKADTVIDFQGDFSQLTPMMEPLDEAAGKLMDAYYKKNPKATISPVDDLPRSMATAVIEEPKALAPVKVGGPK